MILDPPMLPKFLNNYETQKRNQHMNMNIFYLILHLIYQDECWLPVAMDWYYTTRFWNHILQVVSGFCLEAGMGYDLRPPMLPKFLNNYETQKKKWTYEHEHISSYFLQFSSYDLPRWMLVTSGYLWTDNTLQGSEITSSKSFRDFA